MRYSKVLLVFALSLLLIFGSSLSAFATDNAPTITVSVEPATYTADPIQVHGIVREIDHHKYQADISAADTDDYYFVKWQIKKWFWIWPYWEDLSVLADYSFGIREHEDVKAIYAPKQVVQVYAFYPLGDGYDTGTLVSSDKCISGMTKSVTPEPMAGYRLDFWTHNDGPEQDSDVPVSITVPEAPSTINLYFEEIPSFEITSAVEDEVDWGTVTGEGTYVVGSPVNLIAENERGFEFVDWSIVWDSDEFPLPIIDATQKDITFNMPECNGTFTANFEPLTKYGVNLLVGKIVENVKEPASAGEGGNPLFDANVMTEEDGEYDGYYYEGESYNIDPNPFEHWSFVGYDWEGIWEDNDGPEIARVMAPNDGLVPIPMLVFDADTADFDFMVFDFNKEITVYYEEDPYVTATVKYLNTSDIPVQAQIQVKVYLDEAYDLSGPTSIGSYQRIFKSDNAAGTLGEGAKDFTVTNVYQIPPTPQVITNTVTETITETVFVNVPATTAPTTEPATEAVTEEETPLAPATTEPTTEVTTEAPVEVIAVEEVPLADALPQTGQLPSELFYAVGSAISGLGLFLKRRK